MSVSQYAAVSCPCSSSGKKHGEETYVKEQDGATVNSGIHVPCHCHVFAPQGTHEQQSAWRQGCRAVDDKRRTSSSWRKMRSIEYIYSEEVVTVSDIEWRRSACFAIEQIAACLVRLSEVDGGSASVSNIVSQGGNTASAGECAMGH